MKKLALAIVTLLIATTMFAQERQPRSAEERASMQTQQLTKKLALTDDQQKKVHEINLSSAKKVDELREANAGDRAAMMEGMKKINEEKETALKAVLTEKQWADYEVLKKERMEKMKSRTQNQKGNESPANNGSN
ncbi:hypothetical protein [Solitalea lacus]|uniref:hypothetical protein n=1 Tax=Solitalea lacus TaxID=2911172 RepID=UPI001EDB3975|nr:hypothetical protein [Solitalea lacus]UKJ05785.1 hypothetical protein L2B55_09505 [Solitalea lacus]